MQQMDTNIVIDFGDDTDRTYANVPDFVDDPVDDEQSAPSFILAPQGMEEFLFGGMTAFPNEELDKCEQNYKDVDNWQSYGREVAHEQEADEQVVDEQNSEMEQD